ncbi:hypothetical protein RND81_01G169000 [Saponaria officinalis]|uniref:Uncharacterized protein n=1 Tax=Saponaria officinalis TaxID=3572 RepID=A0AAW1KCK9_SAPOF
MAESTITPYSSLSLLFHGSVLMERKFSLLHIVATVDPFSAVFFWYGIMFGRESARKELGNLFNFDGSLESSDFISVSRACS